MKNYADKVIDDGEEMDILRQLSEDAGLMSYEDNVDYKTDVLKAQIVYGVLKELELQHMSSSELAERMKKSRQYVSKLLHEKANFTLKTIAELASALKLKVSVCFSRGMSEADCDVKDENYGRTMNLTKMKKPMGGICVA